MWWQGMSKCCDHANRGVPSEDKVKQLLIRHALKRGMLMRSTSQHIRGGKGKGGIRSLGA